MIPLQLSSEICGKPGVFGLGNITSHVGQGGSQTPESRTEQDPVYLKCEKKKHEDKTLRIHRWREKGGCGSPPAVRELTPC